MTVNGARESERALRNESDERGFRYQIETKTFHDAINAIGR